MVAVLLSLIAVSGGLSTAPEPPNSLNAIGGPDAFGYRYIDSDEPGGPTFAWRSIRWQSGATQVSGLQDDNVVGPFPVGFGFCYYGQTVNSVFVGSNGCITFGDATPRAWRFPDLPNPATPNNMVAAYQCDLNFLVGSAKAFYYTTPDLDTFIVEYDSVPYWTAGGGVGANTFQILLCRSDSSIRVQYLDIDTPPGTPNVPPPSGWVNGNVTIGIENAAGTVGLSYLYGNTPSANHPHDGLVIRYYRTPGAAVHDFEVNAAADNRNGALFGLAGTPKTFWARVKNTGSVTDAGASVTLSVGTHTATATTGTLAPGQSDSIAFAPWLSPPAGTYTMKVKVALAGDAYPANDSVLSVVRIVSGYPFEMAYDDNSYETGLFWDNLANGFANRYVPPDYPVQITSMRFMGHTSRNGSTPVTCVVTMGVYGEDPTTGLPGPLLGSGTVTVSSWGPTWFTVNLASTVTVFEGAFWVAMWSNQTSWPIYGMDTLGAKAHQSWERRNGNWSPAVYSGNYNIMLRPTVAVGTGDMTTVAINVPGPGGTIDSGMVVTPRALVRNAGTTGPAAFTVKLNIAPGYASTQFVRNLAAGDTTSVFFAPWTASPRGALAMKCSTQLNRDAATANDKFSSTINVRVHDVGATAIKVPAGPYDSGGTAVPACSIYNYGTASEGYPVRLRIGAGYNQTGVVSGHAPGTYAYVTFPAWTALERGSNAVTCSTMLGTDARPVNDRTAGTAFVRVHDVAVLDIVNPPAQLPPGTIVPSARVRNNGTQREPLTAVFVINTVPPYSSPNILGGGLPVGVDTVVGFTIWTGQPGTYTAACTVRMGGDQVPANDTLSRSFQVGNVDIVATAIVGPTGDVDSGLAVTPSARVRNDGDFATTFMTWFTMKTAADSLVYFDSLVVNALPSSVETTLVYPDWAKPHPPGAYTARCSTWAASDANPGNNIRSGNFNITFVPPETGWVRKADVPLGAKSKKVKDGGALAYLAVSNADGGMRNGGPRTADADSGFVFALKGNNRYEFYSFNTADNAWVTRESIPAIGRSGKKKAVKKGSALTAGCGRVFGFKGNNSLEFWCYNPDSDAWRQQTDVPTGARTLREGVGAVTVTVGDSDYVYLLRGSGTQDFYRYNLATDVWSSLAPAPLGTSGKTYKNGSALAYNEAARRIYAVKGSYNEFFIYSVDSDRWEQRTSVPLVGRLGKKKKVKDGAGLAYYDDCAYLVKGGNTVEFWKYYADSDKWLQMPDVPAGSGRNVKGGGALCFGDQPQAALYTLKGNNTFDFFKYGFGAMTNDQAPMTNSGVQSASAFRTPHSALRVSPNPFLNATTISFTLPAAGDVSLRLYDVTGKLVTILAHGYHRAGSHSLTLGRERAARGIYLLVMEAGGASTSGKLIIE